MQHGAQTARNRKTGIITSVQTLAWPVSRPMSMWNSDAAVLRNTCAACGSRVMGRKKAIAMPTLLTFIIGTAAIVGLGFLIFDGGGSHGHP